MMAWRARIRLVRDRFSLDLDIECEHGGAFAVVGPNGSGKTTFLRVLAGALEPDHAEIVVGAEVLANSPKGIMLPCEKRRIGYVPQGYGLFPHASVLDNVTFGLSTGRDRLSRSARRERGLQLLAELGCEDLADRPVQGLSGGEQQRVALARALVIEPQLLLLDEPLAALDARTRREVRYRLVERIRSLGRPTIVVTHDPRDLVALECPICVLEEGRVVQRGSWAELSAHPHTDFVAELVGAR